MAGAYLDSSAIVKLVTEEEHSVALQRFLRRRRPHISSALARTEVLRALMFEGEPGVTRGRLVLGTLTLLRVNDRVLNAAATLLPAHLRSLDAIHLATARELGDDVRQLVTYDERMVEAAVELGIRTASPT